ncbi:MAG: hypothetical protein E4H14_06730 [Candidatus Thorarchaeota archaeon]|nr:MAG: hypothetical protein E4H14_06730 [Candidatus Thorarchaeota archaeon]
MAMNVSYKYQVSPEYPHIMWLELQGDGLLHECAILKRDEMGNLFYFSVNALDDIDRRRLAQLLADRNARNFELWDLMSQKTLGNGMNALAYFHQLVKVLTPNGKVLDPRSGVMGMQPTGVINTNPEVEAAKK